MSRRKKKTRQGIYDVKLEVLITSRVNENLKRTAEAEETSISNVVRSAIQYYGLDKHRQIWEFKPEPRR